MTLTIKNRLSVAVWLPFVFAWLTIIFRSITQASTIVAVDVLWQTRDGMEQLTRGGVSVLDTWTWTAYNTEWTPNSWLWNLILGGLYAEGGSVLAFVVFRFVLNIIFFALVWAILSYTQFSVHARIVVLLIIELATPSWTSVRPQMADYIMVLLFAWFVLFITRKTSLSSTQQFGVVVPVAVMLLVFWQNLHFSGILGLALFIFILWLFSKAHLKHRLFASLILLGAGFAGMFLNPYGGKWLENAFEVSTGSSGVLTEWSPLFSPQNLTDFWLVVGFVGSMGLLAMLVMYGRWKLAIILAVSSLVPLLYAVRFEPYVLILGLFFMVFVKPDNLWRGLFDNEDEELGFSQPERKPVVPVVVYSLLSCVIIFVSLLASMGLVEKIHEDRISGYYADELNIIPKNQRVYTTVGTAGIIEFARPDLRPIVDARMEIWGTEYVKQIKDLTAGFYGGETFLKCLDEESINVIVLSADTPSAIPSYLMNDWEYQRTDHYRIYIRPTLVLVPPLSTGDKKLECLA